MDPLSAGASVVTFLGLAFSVTKTIHDVLSTIKDGPQVIQHLKEEFSQLRSILERLAHISLSATDAVELDVLAKKCNDDVASFETRLSQLDTSGADGRRGRLWRKLKLCFTEKDLEQMRHIVRGHVQFLTIQLNLLQVQQGSFSATQSTEILNLLQKLREDVATLHQNNPVQTAAKDQTPPRIVEFDMAEDVPCTDSDLPDSITRLMHLLEKKPCVLDSDDAEELVDDLERLLQSVQDEASTVTTSGSAFDSNVSHDDGTAKDLKLMRGVILSAPSLNVNRSGPLGLLKAMSRGTIVHQERNQKIIDIGDGVVTLTSARRRCRHRGHSGDSMSRQSGHGRDFVAKLVFKPKNTNKMLTVSVNQGQVMYDTFTSILPQIIVNSILPPRSPVFSIAASGSVQELMGLVADGNASLHDHDINGQSLLHYSLYNLPMCKFLIKQGLDVDEQCAQGRTPIHQSMIILETFLALLAAGADPTIGICGDSALKNITDATGPYFIDHFRELCTISPFVRYADQETFEDNPFLTSCRQLFTYSPTAARAQMNFQKVSILLEIGYSVNTRWEDGTNCLTQAFLSFKSNGLYEPLDYAHARKAILTCLVSHKADINSTDNKGRCVSDFAYNRVFCTPCSESFIPYMGDLWDSVLDECGYDILPFRRLCPRQARYTGIYTRQAFERLWEGREHRCPYWNDAPWPNSSPEDVPRTWTFLDENGKACEQCPSCQSCFESHFEREGSICGKCGFCNTVLGCQCAQDGANRNRVNCLRPLRRGIRWDEGQNRYIYHGDDASSAHDASYKDEFSGGVAMDYEVCSVGTLSERSDGEHQKEADTIIQEDEHWNGLSSSSLLLSALAVGGSPLQNELFWNPWE